MENIASTSLSLNLIIITSVYSYDNVCSDSKSSLDHTITQAASLLALELYKDSIKQHAFTNLLKVFNIDALIFLKSYIQSSGTFFFITYVSKFFQEMDIHLLSVVVAFGKCFPLNLVNEENIEFINSNVIECA